MNCYLHIGTEKTATTTIQSFLLANKYKLSKLGFGYTNSAGEKNNFKLAIAAYNTTKRDDLTRICNIRSDKELFNFQQTVIKKLGKEIRTISLPNVVFSSEHIQSRLTSLQEIESLKQTLKNIGFSNISVIVYLRNPAEIANSLYTTAILSGHTITSPLKPGNKYINNLCNHKRTLENYSSVFGENALLPRIFDNNEFINGSILEDFAKLIGLKWDNSFIRPKNLNEGLSILGLQILQRVNKKIPKFINNKINPIRSDIARQFQENFSHNKYYMHSQLWEEYNTTYHESNEWVKAKWFPERESLFCKKESPKESKIQISSTELDIIANAFAEMWIEKCSKINSKTKKSTARPL